MPFTPGLVKHVPWNPTFRKVLPFGAPLWYWMSERQAIWKRRADGLPRPWTHDLILQSFRFCNVFRELDKVTEWIRDEIRIPFEDHPHLWFMLAAARYINFPPTLAELMSLEGAWPSSRGFNPKNMTEVLDLRKTRGQQIYTGAYMIRAESDPRTPWYKWTKQRYVSEVVLGRLWEDRDRISGLLKETKTLRGAWEILCRDSRYVGWGPFMTYEWVTDLRWTRYLEDAEDKMSWANAGPGALRGIRRLKHPEFKLVGSESVTQKEALVVMEELLKEAPKNLPPEIGGLLEMRDIEHSLCETDKYLRVFHGEGKPRSSYNGK